MDVITYPYWDRSLTKLVKGTSGTNDTQCLCGDHNIYAMMKQLAVCKQNIQVYAY